ncbi:hypothetical protein BMR1_03g03710 [Babesia microti strain RI]|uniref:Uncharacterized protein n=1 Tax=Babesia microti (strain RI) TaxID=1133968 RepID=A0A0K3APB8_BABMR|nr:hypothetical protein BMR1_03g03710 [Babesia microti strain RI]CTQ41342.1 hypothetical protein BMR1_03g03710 [Babesia microti strain RI]|eukprot:XP_012649353.1 hypothetical protein BMR1_03g03710 [Babesia microti strain RI]
MRGNYLLSLLAPLAVICVIDSRKKLLDRSVMLKIREIADRTHMMSGAVSKNAFLISKVIDNLSSQLRYQSNTIVYDNLENRNKVFGILDSFLKIAKEDRYSRGPPQISEMRAELKLVQNEVKILRSELESVWHRRNN